MSKTFDFSALEAAAVKNNFVKTSSRTPFHELSIEEARKLAKVRDGNKVANEDGSQALTLCVSKYVLPLDVISKGATRVNATAEQVESYTETLLAGVEAGAFDEAIVEAQAKSEATYNARKEGGSTAPVAEEEPAEEQAPEGIDLDAL